ncbi:phage stabilization protein [Caudoviricetes sp.]|nr:phage stabilization protein [Caudoviricetes sp.]
MTKLGDTKIPAKKVKSPQRLVILNPSKGLNNLVSPGLIDNREFADLMNVEYDEGGVIRKRAGYTTAGDALTNARGLGVYATESTRQMVTVDNGTLKYRTTGNWSSATGATFNTSKETCFTQARLKLFIWDGDQGGAYFTGSAVTRPGTMPKAKFSVYYQSKHIASGVDGQPSRLYISNLSDATDFTVTTGGTQPQPDSTNDSENGNPNVPGATTFAGTPAMTEANVIDIRKNDGDKITGLAVFQDVLIVFKERSIYQVTFDTSGNPTVTPITYATGCISHKSIVNVENDIYFMSREGMRVLGNEPQFFAAIRTQVLSIRVQPNIDGISKAYYSLCNGVYFDNKYILGYPTGTSSSISRCLVYDRRFQAFTVWQSFNARDMVKFIDSDNSESPYFLDTAGTQVYKRVAGTYADNGAAIEAWVVSKAQDLGNPDITKFWVDIRLIFRRLTGLVQLTVYSDDDIQVGTTTIGSGALRGLGMNTLGTFKLGTDGESTVAGSTFVDAPQSIGLNLDSRSIKFKIYNNRVNENFVLLGIVYAYYPKSHFVFDSSRKIYL